MSNAKSLPAAATVAPVAPVKSWGALLGGSAIASVSAATVPAFPAPGDIAAAKSWAVAVSKLAAGYAGRESVKRLDTDAARERQCYSLAAAVLNDAGIYPPADLTSYRYPAASPKRGTPAWQSASLFATVRGFNAL